MAAIAVGERKNGGALIVVRIVLPSGFDPADYSVLRALFGMIFPPRVRGAVNGSRRGVKRPRWEVESHRGPLPNDSTLGGQVGWRLITDAHYHRVVGPNFKFRPAFTTVLILIGNAATVQPRVDGGQPGAAQTPAGAFFNFSNPPKEKPHKARGAK
jgi:hypothetical protein